MTKKIVIIGMLLLLIGSFFLFGGQDYLSLESIQQHKNQLSHYVEGHYWQAIAIASLVYILATTLSLPGAVFLSLTIGFVFGRWVGTGIILVSATIGATFLFWLARYLFSDWVKIRLQNNQMAQKLLSGFTQHALNYLLFLRLVPLFPFWLINLTVAFTKISSKDYIIASFFGMMPASFVFANLGQSLAGVNSMEQLISQELMISFSLLGLLMLVPIIASKRKQVSVKG